MGQIIISFLRIFGGAENNHAFAANNGGRSFLRSIFLRSRPIGAGPEAFVALKALFP